ncbi:hypothetical protein CCP2SC5_590017 [Azospirillaceae bacterium]
MFSSGLFLSRLTLFEQTLRETGYFITPSSIFSTPSIASSLIRNWQTVDHAFAVERKK